LNCSLSPIFVADVMLGKLSRYLLICGYDCEYRKNFPDRKLVEFARSEQRIILSRDHELCLELAADLPTTLIRSTKLRKQLRQLKEEYELTFTREQLFQRCLKCNQKVVPVERKTVSGKVPAKTYNWIDDYYRCSDCASIYWHGTHFEAIEKRLNRWNLLDD